jgi:DNA polymerase-3 subunit delta'
MAFASFSKIIGQERAVNYVKRVVGRDKLSHAYLFTGIPGIGKKSTAYALAQAVNCYNPTMGEGCGQCMSCRQMMAGNHPDLLVIKPDGQAIKIDQIRHLIRDLGFKKMFARFRVSIVCHAETMTEEAANAFLKILEEPPEANILILDVVEARDLLPTIVSRCQKVSFLPLPSTLIADWLTREQGLVKDQALVVAKIADGSLGRAIEMTAGGFLEKRHDFLLRLFELPQLAPEEAMEVGLSYAGMSKRKELDVGGGDGGLFGLLSVWKTWYRDLLIVKTGAPEDLLINVDFGHKLKNMAEHLTIHSLLRSFEVLNQAQHALKRFRNVDLMMENTVLTLKRLASQTMNSTGEVVNGP